MKLSRRLSFEKVISFPPLLPPVKFVLSPTALSWNLTFATVYGKAKKNIIITMSGMKNCFFLKRKGLRKENRKEGKAVNGGGGEETSRARNESSNWILACIRLCVCLCKDLIFRQSFYYSRSFWLNARANLNVAELSRRLAGLAWLKDNLLSVH